MKLVKPSVLYKDSFITGVKEYQAVDVEDRRDIFELNVSELESDFPLYIKKLLSESKGKNLPKGYVPQTTYWLVDQGEFIGRAAIRHTLSAHLLKEGGHIGYDVRPSKRNQGYGKKLLELALLKAKELGIDKALVICNETNTSSRKIIEANGGKLKNTIMFTKGKPKKLRYWIKL